MSFISTNYNVENQQINTLNTEKVQKTNPKEYIKNSEIISIDDRNKISSEFANSKLQGKYLEFAIDILTYLRSTGDGNTDISALDVEEFVVKNYNNKGNPNKNNQVTTKV